MAQPPDWTRYAQLKAQGLSERQIAERLNVPGAPCAGSTPSTRASLQCRDQCSQKTPVQCRCLTLEQCRDLDNAGTGGPRPPPVDAIGDQSS